MDRTRVLARVQHRVFAVGAALCLLVLVAGPAAAGGKPQHFLITDYSFSYPAGLTCSFAVSVAVETSGLRQTFFPVQANGDQVMQINGHSKVTLTNATSGKSVAVGTGGRANFTQYADGSYAIDITGSVVGGYFPTDVGGPGLFYFVGHLQDTADSSFNILTHQTTGTVQDLCAALAA
jgi:hypothetical protein